MWKAAQYPSMCLLVLQIFDMCRNNNIPDTLQRTHGKIIGQVIRSTQMLDSALLRLDSQIAILNDF